ncbi:YeeE/YedE family protein [Endozoicomonas ascidiicola]|uniref:YeeE/YedE family protein n=1 Tax=Endozoicomonas ascidiicola TaxID=1698521 RepID=UPI00082D4989|nr:YeeE/YedE family protein [Endozoicomonas ascidiicola]
MFYIISLLTGLIFGIGMALSGMIDPAVVIAFLDVAGEWNPALMFVMGGALLVFIPGYQLLIKKRQQPVIAEKWSLNSLKALDRPLIIGAALFGLGWGILGVCPGPAVTSMLAGNSDVWLFMAAMIAGLFISQKLKQKIN